MTKFPLSTKSAFKANKNKKEIESLRKYYNETHHGEITHVIYCFDTDTDKPGAATLNNSIMEYCHENHYPLIWFNKDVEDVFLGQTISDKKKVREATNFVKQKKIENFDLTFLCCKSPLEKEHFSNLKFVFDPILGSL